jgi:serine/threonine protein kinase
MQSCSICGKDLAQEMRFCSWCGAPINGGTLTGLLAPRSLLHDGRYLIIERVGKGGMAAVYKAQDLHLGQRCVAIKEMSQTGLSGFDLQIAITSFTHEARMLAQLKHPGLPHIYEQFEQAGRRYLVMEFIEGETLEHLLEKLRRQGSLLTPQQALAIGRQICIVLDYLHSQQPPIIFRDLKPANIMLTARQQVYLIDFGIARFFRPDQAGDTVALGSPGYAPPEQYRKATSPRSDIYSLGAILHQMLSGDDPAQSPFHFKPLLLGLPHLEQLVQSMVDLNEYRRPASMRIVLKTLDDIVRRAHAGQAKAAREGKSRRGRSGKDTITTGNGQRSAPPASPTIHAIISAQSEDQRLWSSIHQQLVALTDGFPALQFVEDVNGQSMTLDRADLVLLLLSDAFLASPGCMAAASRAIDRHEAQDTPTLSIMLRPCTLAHTRLANLRTIPDDAIAHLSLYAQEQRSLEAAREIRTQLVALLTGRKRYGPMNLLQWLLWQLYGNGLASCRYFIIGRYALKHVRPAGMASILIHLLDLQKGGTIGEYLIGPVRCDDLTSLLRIIAPSALDPQTVAGIARRQVSLL